VRVAPSLSTIGRFAGLVAVVTFFGCSSQPADPQAPSDSPGPGAATTDVTETAAQDEQATPDRFSGYVAAVSGNTIVVVDPDAAGIERAAGTVEESSVLQIWMDGAGFPVGLGHVRPGARIAGTAEDGRIVRGDFEDVPVDCTVTTGSISRLGDDTVTVTAAGDTAQFDLGPTSYLARETGGAQVLEPGTAVSGDAVVVACSGVVRFVDPIN
jgi:hypothetical protein